MVLLLLLAMVAGVVLVLVGIWSLLGTPGRLAGGLGGGMTDAAGQAQRAAAEVAQSVRDATDPTHPPSGLTYDNEFSTLQTFRVGDTLPGGRDYRLSVSAIRRRDGADSSDTALYAVLHAELRQPRETRLLGQLIRSDADPHDHYVYKGESLRIGQMLYRVNWVSQEDGGLALASYRRPDQVSAPLKVQYE